MDMSDSQLNPSLKAPPNKPILKMKRIKVLGNEVPGKVTFLTYDKRLILEMTTPHPDHADCVDVRIGPDAKLDEIASVLAELWGNCILLNYNLKFH